MSDQLTFWSEEHPVSPSLSLDSERAWQTRGNLALEFCRLALRARPRWIVWENVPGVLSSNGGRDFGAFLGALAECGYGFAYRVLDAQYVRVESHPFAVPQRRRRVFVVGYLGDWRPPAAVLLERESLRGHSPPRRQAQQDVAKALRGCANSSHREDSDNFVASTLPATDGGVSSGMHPVVAHAVNAKGGTGRMDAESETFICCDGSTGKFRHSDVSASMTTGTDQSRMSALVLGRRPQAGASQANVRRMTPRECERLMGLPDDFTLVPYRGKPSKDGPRYKAIGNSIAVNVMSWIGERIEEIDQMCKSV